MSDHNLPRCIRLELRLKVAHAKFAMLQSAAEDMVSQVLGEHTNKTPRESAEQLQATLRELENTATDLHN
jgi:hypothetical protein